MPKRVAGESDAYAVARARLLEEEVALKEHVERVAAMRRGLPRDTPVEDYVFREGPRDLDTEGPSREVRLSELFDDPDRALVVYQFMYGGAQTSPCPVCSMWIDGFAGVARHLDDTMNFAVVARAGLQDLRAWGRHRGWAGLRLVSAAGTSFKRDLRMENEDGTQNPGLSVFVLGPDGSPRHFYTGEAHLVDEHWRGIDLCSPVWNLLDLTPAGRGDWLPSLEYGEAARSPGEDPERRPE